MTNKNTNYFSVLSCWKRTIQLMEVFFKETRALRLSAFLAHNANKAQDMNAMFLHNTVQELCIMQIFKEKDWKNQPAIQ